MIYPFGYGLSYISLSQAIQEASYGDGNFSFTVDVTNTSAVAELYAETPYAPGGIEKSKAVSCGFDKTQILNLGETETVTITVKRENIAFDDDQINKSYILDAGDYTFNSHVRL